MGLGEEPRGQETWVGLSSASALLHDLVFVILDFLGVLAPFSGHRLRPERSQEKVGSRHPGALFHLCSARLSL